MVEIDIQTISIVIAAMSVVIAAANSIQASREAQKTRESELENRQAQLFMEIYNRFNDKEFSKMTDDVCFNWQWKDYDEFMEKYGYERNIEAWGDFSALFNFFEGIGVLLKQGLIRATLVSELMSGPILRYWEKFEPILNERREHLTHHEAIDNVEYLYREVRSLGSRARE